MTDITVVTRAKEKVPVHIYGGRGQSTVGSLVSIHSLLLKKLRIPHHGFHALRHTHATLLINEAVNIQEVTRWLGHSDVQMTWRTYARLYPGEEELAVLDKIR